MTQLAVYNEKRDFKKTSEPKGKRTKTRGVLRYVVQHHLASRDHFDFRLEWDGMLLSWAVPKGPSMNPADKRLAVEVEPHPLDYRDFEGTIPKGEYGGGTVMLWDEGTWEPVGDVDLGMKKGSLKLNVHGTRLKGRWALVRMEPKASEKQPNWLLIKDRDEFAKPDSGAADYTTSIRTGRTMSEITAGTTKNQPRNPKFKISPQLAKLVSDVPKTGNWLYEMKYDGYRIFALIEGGTVKLQSRNGNDYTDKFRAIADTLTEWSRGRAMIIDGEIVVADEKGKSDFQALQNYLKRPHGRTLSYAVFDLLALNGEDIREKPLTERKSQLEKLLKNAPPSLQYSRHVEGNGRQCLAAACSSGMEGIIGKLAESTYGGKCGGDWIKLKCGMRQEFVIGGFTRTEKKPSGGFSALLLGYYDGKRLIYAGRVGTGFSRSVMTGLENKFAPLERKTSPFANAPKSRAGESVTWLRPQFVAEIKFAEWTDENQLRQASFQGLRSDKAAKDVVREDMPKSDDIAQDAEAADSLTPGGIPISNPDKILFKNPAVTKGDVAAYYAKVADAMLPYVKNRVLSAVRCPKGVSEPCFYKKHPVGEGEGVERITIANSDGEESEYFYLKNAAGLISEVQLGTLEFHTWGSTVKNLDKPDIMVFDLDPDEGMELKTVRQGVLDLKSVLTDAGLEAFLKTSGGKGYHVVVPIKPAVNWEVFNNFAKQVAIIMEQKWPDRYTSNMRKISRKGKIFIDWVRNGRGATSIAPYSIRAREGAAVSMPISWDELSKITPDGIKMTDAIKRLSRPDPWDGFHKPAQTIK